MLAGGGLMAVVSTVPTLFPNLRDQLRDRLDAADGFEDVAVYTAPMGESSALEAITLVSMDPADETWAAIAPTLPKEERYTVRGDVVVVMPGADEEVATAARDRVYAIFEHLRAELRADPSVGGAVRICTVLRSNLRQGASPAGRGAVIDFSLAVQARLAP
jgi:hypothetical protein